MKHNMFGLDISCRGNKKRFGKLIRIKMIFGKYIKIYINKNKAGYFLAG